MADLKFLNIHGYIGNGEDSTSDKMLKELGVEVVSPTLDYDKNDANSIFAQLRNIYDKEGCNGVIGCSLGGFFALQICAYYDCPAILINPCVMPFVYLRRCNYHGSLTAYIKQFGNIADVDKRLIMTLVGFKDELIDTGDVTAEILDNGFFEIDDEGGHRTSSLAKLPDFLKRATEKAKTLLGGVNDTEFPID